MIGRTELFHLTLSWAVLGFAFSVGKVFSAPRELPLFFAISLLTVGLGFILHELAHKFVAQKFGYWAEFRLSPMGLAMAVLFATVTGGRLIFAAPGATYIIPKSGSFGYEVEHRESAIVSLAGPLTNIVLALGFFILPTNFLLLRLVKQIGFSINIWLAAFNMLPFGGLDGQKVFSWNKILWVAVAIPIFAAVAIFIF